jgi:hypothetical protein
LDFREAGRSLLLFPQSQPWLYPLHGPFPALQELIFWSALQHESPPLLQLREMVTDCIASLFVLKLNKGAFHISMSNDVNPIWY